MKRLFLLVLLFVSTYAFAEIPGYVEIEASGAYWNKSQKDNYDLWNFCEASINMEYGSDFNLPYNFFNMYGFFNYTNHFIHEQGILNKPYRDVYTVGAGVRFFDIFYFEFSHVCTHYVVCDMNNGEEERQRKTYYEKSLPLTHNVYRIGAKFRFE